MAHHLDDSQGYWGTMDKNFTYNPNDDKQNHPFCRLKLLVEKFGFYLFGTNQSKSTKSIE